MQKSLKKTFTLRLSDKQIAYLIETAEREDRTVSQIIRRIIDEKRTQKSDTKRTEGSVAL